MRKQPPRANGLPTESFIIYDESSSYRGDDYLIHSDYPIETYLLKNATAGKPVSYARIGLKLQHQRKKSPLTNKSVFDNRIPIISAHCKLPYVGLQPKPVHNSLFSLI
jgi:hypothetical protein